MNSSSRLSLGKERELDREISRSMFPNRFSCVARVCSMRKGGLRKRYWQTVRASCAPSTLENTTLSETCLRREFLPAELDCAREAFAGFIR